MEQQIQQAVTENPYLLPILGALFTMILGAYKYTHGLRKEIRASIRDLWGAIAGIKENEIEHLQAEIDELKKR